MIFYADPATKAYHGGGKKIQLALQTRRAEGTEREMKRACEKERRKYGEQRKKERALRTV